MAHIGLGDAVSRRVSELGHFFSKDRRFESKGLIATGSYGFTIRVEVRDSNMPGLRDIVVKRARGGADARANLVAEKASLEWPNASEEPQRDVELSGIVHGDLHQGNVLIGEPPNDEEHTIAPILKLIDFGSTEQYPAFEEGDTQNVYDIGQYPCRGLTGLIDHARPYKSKPRARPGGRKRDLYMEWQTIHNRRNPSHPDPSRRRRVAMHHGVRMYGGNAQPPAFLEYTGSVGSERRA
ncbi:hypothetical protein Daesc_002662 [Daldinia eschscholtzii]|uniref:Protein kinase domain-containing protein n=1 Tax=Daldinia eschscholtzii TaxID=292717 RepID=A0AAX6MS81_9PEZI